MFNEKVKVNKIDVSQILGHITIKPHDAAEVKVETTQKEKVEIKHVGTTLFIKTKFDDNQSNNKNSKYNFGGSFIQSIVNGKNVTISNNFNGNVVIGNGNVIMGNVGEMAEVEMIIYVPKEMVTKIDISGQISVSVEGISKKLRIDNSGQTKIDIADVVVINIDTSGQSRATIYGVEEMSADVSGQSRLDIESDEIKDIELDVSGQSSADVYAKLIQHIEVDASGMSRVVVRGSVMQKHVDESGMSKVTFR